MKERILKNITLSDFITLIDPRTKWKLFTIESDTAIAGRIKVEVPRGNAGDAFVYYAIYTSDEAKAKIIDILQFQGFIEQEIEYTRDW